MESQPQNPDFRNNPENFHPCLTHRFIFIASGYFCVGVGALCPSQQFFTHVGTHSYLPGLNHYYNAEDKVACLSKDTMQCLQ